MTPPLLELWGGVECTVVRLGDLFRDQAIETGHRDRPSDLDAIAALGIRTLRYPILWETLAPERPAEYRWEWHDERLAQLRERAIRPIAGLLHHGSGPTYTNLLDPEFPRLFARHAARVARRYPWITDFTPVNEPLTTARFSALYGHWYPHQRSYPAFLAALVNQCRATVLAMRAIRRVTPQARLIQTDDLGKTFSTPPLAYQAEHENGRRWLAFDLLCGRVDPKHPWWRILRDNGITERTLAFFLDGAGAPDVIGVNHYLTSERFLDQRLHLYPPHLHGGNHREAYADVEAVRCQLPEHDIGPAARLREAWARYGRPIAVTEVHHGCTREEQLRWLAEIWQAALQVKAEGADIRAVTLWSLFGAIDWSTLLTERRGIYEPGAFDIRGKSPRPTALAGAAQQLTTTGRIDHPVVAAPGWWKRSSRYYGGEAEHHGTVSRSRRAAPLLIEGAGALARTFARLCAVRGLDHVLVERGGMGAGIERHRPWAVIDASAGAASEWEAVSGGDAAAPSIADLCARHAIPLIALSSDLVFDGRLGRAYGESDPVDATRAAAAEARVAAAHPAALILRGGPFFGPSEGLDAHVPILARLTQGRAVGSETDIVSPTYTPDFVHVALDLLIDGECGIWHLTNPGPVSWLEFARAVGAQDAGRIVAATSGLPLNHALVTDKGDLLPPLHSALDRFLAEERKAWNADPALGVAAA